MSAALDFDPDVMTPRGEPPSAPPSLFWLGLGFAADSYDLFVVNLALQFLIQDGKPGHNLNSVQESWVASMAIVGAMIGQVTLGALSQRIGRVRVGLLTLSLIAIGSLGSSLLTLIAAGFFANLLIWRFVLGIGIGGEYPLSSVLVWEFSPTNQLRNIAFVFSMQGVGAMISPILILILLQFTSNKETIWRLAFGFSVLPCLLLLYPRFRMKETREFRIYQRRQRGEATIEEEAEGQAYDDRHGLKRNNGRDSSDAPQDPNVEERASLMAHQSQSRRESVPLVHAESGYSINRMLIGTCLVWFLFDVAFYANSMFNSSILQTLGLGSDLSSLTLMTFYITLIAMPGYVIGIFLIQHYPLFWIQVIGFVILTMLYLLLAIVNIKNLSGGALIIIYGLTFLVSNAGPNLTTYVIPVSIFPTHQRMHYHGLSAAAGKFGALIGTALLKPVLDRWGVSVVLLICAVVSGLGIVVTFLCLPMRIGSISNPGQGPAVEDGHHTAKNIGTGSVEESNKQI